MGDGTQGRFLIMGVLAEFITIDITVVTRQKRCGDRTRNLMADPQVEFNASL